MKKLVRNIFAGLTALAMICSVTACKTDDDEETKSNPFVKPVVFETEGAVGNVVTFNVTTATTGTTNKITLKYRRSAAGAAEKIILQNAVYKLMLNNGKIEEKTGDLTFVLNKYGSCFDFAEGVASEPSKCPNGHYDANGKITDLANCAEYQCELSYSNKLAKGDVVKFQLISAKIAGEGAAKQAEILPKVKVILIDADQAVNWYKEVFDYKKESEGGKGYPLVFKTGKTLEGGQAEDLGLLEAKFNTGAWSGMATIGADKLASVKMSDKLIITYEMNNDGDAGYHMFQILNGADSEDKLKEVSGLAEDGSYTFVINAANAEILKTKGVKFQGNGVTLTKVVLEEGDGTDPEPPAGDGTVVLLNEVKTGDWNNVLSGVDASAYANATDDTVIVMTVSKDTDRLVGGTDAAPDYSECYTLIQMLDFSAEGAKFSAGTVTNGTLNEGAKQIEGMFKNEDTNEVFYEVTYKPTAEEWAKIKTTGLGIQAHGVMFKKIVLSTPAGDNDPEELALLTDLTLGWSGNDTICAGKNVAVGGTIYFTMTATGGQECQFIKKGWAGGLGTGVITILDKDGTDVTYYAKGEEADAVADRPAVGLTDKTETFHFAVTEAFVALKEVATVVGSAKIDKMWYVPAN